MTRPLLRSVLALLPLPLPLLLTAACVTAGRSGGGGGELRLGQTATGRLTLDAPQFADGSHYRLFPFTGRGGDTVTAELESVDFDANLILTDGHGNRIAGNDDGGEHCNARLVHTPPDDRPLRIVVNTARKHETGRFVLRVTVGRAITDPKGSCARPG